MAVIGEPVFQGEQVEPRLRALQDLFRRIEEPQPLQGLVQGQAGVIFEDTTQMER